MKPNHQHRRKTNLENMKKTLLFTLLTIALILTGCTQEPVKTQPASEKTEKLESEVTFKLINRETKNPINKKLIQVSIFLS